jgi:FG-GAP-like repeat
LRHFLKPLVVLLLVYSCGFISCLAEASTDTPVVPESEVAEQDTWPKTFTTRVYPIYGGVISYSDALPQNYYTELKDIAVLNPSRMETGDFDEDGNLDFLVTTIFGDEGDAVSMEDALQGIVTLIERPDANSPWPLIGTWPTPLVLLFGDGEGGVREAVQLTTYTNGTFVTTADLDSDGHLDIICELSVGHPDWEAPNRPLLLLYGDGLGGFPYAQYVDIDPTWFVSAGRWVAADMNGDAILDLVSVGHCSFETPGTLLGAAVLLGTEEGSYANARRACLGEFALVSGAAFEVLDVDSDGDLDVAAAVTVITPSLLDPSRYIQVGHLVTLENDGTGELSTEGGRMIPLQPKAMAVGDFNGDGIKDLAVSHFADAEITESETRGPNGEVLYDYHRLGGSSSNATIFQGDGDGGFDEGTAYDLRVYWARLMAGDLDADGFDDLVAISPEDRRLSVLLGGAEGLGGAKLYEQRSHTRWADCLGDFNGDGVLDIGVLGASSGHIETMFGDGEGGFGSGWFSPPLETQIPFAPRIPTQGGAADFDGDGHLDVLFFRDSFDDIAGIAFGDGSGRITEVVLIEFGDIAENYGINAVTAGDLNHDGRRDVVVAYEEKGYQAPSYLSVFLGTSDRSFSEHLIEFDDQGVHVTGLALGDFDGNGETDIFAAFYTYERLPQVFLGNGEATFGSPIEVLLIPEEDGKHQTSYYDFFVVDVNEDGIDDLVTKSYLEDSTDVFLGTPSGMLRQALRLSPGRFLEGAADYNADGHVDVLISGSFFAGDGTGEFEELVNEDFRGVPVIDLNRDGYFDRISDYQNSLFIYVGDGAFGALASDAFVTSGERHTGFGDYAFGDFNEDGWQDIAYTAGEWLGILLVQPNRLPVFEEEEGSSP